MKQITKQIANFFLDIIFPEKCIICGRLGEFPEKSRFCKTCLGSLDFVPEKADGFEGKHMYFIRNFSMLYYDEQAKKLIHGFKYHKHPAYGCDIAQLMFTRLGYAFEFVNKADCLIPIPLHPSRFSERGYNQAEILAAELGRLYKKPVLSDVLLRIKETEKQSSLNFEERFENMSGAFAVKNPELCSGKKAILIDDIYTTGATLESCAQTLKNAGCEEIYCMTAATSNYSK